MQTSQWTDDQFLAAINGGGLQRQAALRAIYDDHELKRKVMQFVRNRQGNADDGQDMFHEGIIVLDRNIREHRFRGEAPLKGYLYSICRFLWMNQLRKQAHTTQGAETMLANEPDEHTPELTLLTQERKDLLNSLLSQLGERCQRILELWKLSYSIKEIAAAIGFTSADMARKAKYRCHLSLVELVQQNPDMQKVLSLV